MESLKFCYFMGFFYLNQIKFQVVFIWNCIWFGQKEPIKKKIISRDTEE